MTNKRHPDIKIRKAPTLTPPVIKVTNLAIDTDEKHTVEFFVHDNRLHCSDPNALDYYHVNSSGNGDGLWIHPSLLAWARKNGWYWDWENAETISLNW